MAMGYLGLAARAGRSAAPQQVSFLSPDYGAIQAGFKSAADQQANRMMRNQLEMKAAQAGVSNEEAYKLVEGPLTSTSALQEAWNKLPGTTVQKQTIDPGPPATDNTKQGPSQSDIYKQQADEAMAAAQKILDEFRIEQRRSQEAAALAEKMRIQSQQTLAANMARSQMTPNLQIQPASGTPQTGGTQSFRRRQSQFTPRGEAGAVLAGLNLGQSNMLNV